MKRKKALLWLAAGLPVVLVYGIWGCPIRLLTGVSCPGCGMSRAALRCLHLDFAGALHFHPLVFVLPFFAAAFFLLRRRTKPSAWVLAVFCLSLVAVYIWRMAAGVSPDVVYFHPEQGVIYKVIRSVYLWLSTKCFP